MESRLLTKNDFSNLHKTFCLAFSEYKVEFNLTAEEFDTRIHEKMNIDYNLSGGSFDGDEMIGFILHSSNLYEGIPTAFNAGTGVIPGFRNQRTGEELYEYLLPKITATSNARILLEVIESNEQAVRLYEKLGFIFRRKFLCYKMENPNTNLKTNNDIVEGSVADIDVNFADFEPSFADSTNQLLLGKETVLSAKRDGKTAAYIVFQPSIGRISQLAVSRAYRRQGLATSLIAEALRQSKKSLTIMNIPEDELGVQKFLDICGFQNQINQFEMELII